MITNGIPHQTGYIVNHDTGDEDPNSRCSGVWGDSNGLHQSSHDPDCGAFELDDRVALVVPAVAPEAVRSASLEGTVT